MGARIVACLRHDGHTALAAGRDPARADRVVDLTDPEMYRRSLTDVGVVVNASGVEDPVLAEIATNAGAGFVDITATSSYVGVLDHMNPPAPLVVSVGLAPGLTNLLAAAMFAHRPGPMRLAVLLGAGEAHGAAATDWSLRLLGSGFREPDDDRWIRNYTHGAGVELPGYGRRRLYRLDFSDQHTLTNHLGVPVRTHFRSRLPAGHDGFGGIDLVAGCIQASRGIPPSRIGSVARTRSGRRWAHLVGRRPRSVTGHCHDDSPGRGADGRSYLRGPPPPSDHGPGGGPAWTGDSDPHGGPLAAFPTRKTLLHAPTNPSRRPPKR